MPRPQRTRIARTARWRARGVIAAMVLAGLTACSAPAHPEPAPSPVAVTEEPGVVDTSTLQTMIDSPREKSTLVIGASTDESDETVTSYGVTYSSAGSTVSGTLRVPTSDGPHPAVVVVHGGVDPESYTSGGDLVAEQQALVASGYVVLAVDMRGYAESDAADAVDNLTVDPGFGWAMVLDWGMAWDVVNALDILRSGQVAGVDPSRIGLLGHSMGGLLALDAAVIAPGSSDMIVTLSAATSSFGDVVEQLEGAGDASEAGGSPPSRSPEYWADVSPITFFDRATEPLLMVHGSDDDVAPSVWSEETAAAWKAQGLQADVVIIDGADHALKPHRDEAVKLMLAAFDATIGAH